MAIANIFTAQTTDLAVEPQYDIDPPTPIIIKGVCRIDISGVLDGATMTTQYLDGSTWVDVDEATWDDESDPAPVLPNTALPLIDVHQIGFILSNSGEATDITVTLTYDQ